MFILFHRIILLLCILGSCAYAENPPSRENVRPHPNLILAPDNSGDFGPQTPGTKTCGWQEALDACVAQGRDLYVKGGFGGRKAIYNIQDTIVIPPTQDFRIDGGVYVLNWVGPADDPGKDLMRIDSTMNGEYHFGVFVYGGAGAALRIRPEKPVPVDNFSTVIETVIVSQGIADPAPFTPGERKAGTGLVLDGRLAAITASRFDFIGGILNFKTCIETLGPFVQNEFNCLHLHTNASKSTLFKIGPECVQNTFACVIGVDQGATEVRGIEVQGRNNVFRLQPRSAFPRGNAIFLGEKARGNRIELIQGPDTFDPDEYLTDNAQVPTNILTWVGDGITPRTIPVGASPFIYTQRLFSATAYLKGGTVSRVELLRGDNVLELTEARQSGIALTPGDRLRVTYTESPTLNIVPARP